MKRKPFVILAWLVVLSFVMAACAQATPTQTVQVQQPTAAQPAETEETAAQPTATTAAAAEPTDTQQAAAEPTATTAAAAPSVDPSGQAITLWHVWGTGTPSEAMQQIVDQFNETNEWGITVEALDQGNYRDLEDAMNAAIQSGDVPNLVVGYSNALANWYQAGVLADLNDYVDDPTFGLTEEEKADFYPGLFDSAVVSDGARVGFPISQSANVIFYNVTWAQELGFDSPPSSPEEFKEQACAAAEANNNDDNPDNDGMGGLVLYPGASDLASWVFAFGGDIVSEDGQSYSFNNQAVQDAARFLQDLQASGCAFQTESYPNPEFATRKALFTVSSTAGLPYQIEAFAAEGASPDEWTLLAFPGPDGGKAVNSFGQTIGIVDTTPEQNMAAWLFLKFFSSPEVQAQWIESSAYYPTRASVAPLLESYAEENPIWQVGLSHLEFGKAEPAKPSWASVRRAVQDTLTAIIQGAESDIEPMLAELDEAAAEAVAETDQ